MLRLLALLMCTVALAAQTVPPGHAASVQNLAPNIGQVLVLASGQISFDGTALVLSDGTNQRTLLSFPSPVFGSFTIEVGGNAVLFGESSTGGVWLVPLAPLSQPRKLADVPFNYDACRWTTTHALISAKTGGFSSPDNNILAIDLGTGALDRIAVLPGASGPVVLDAAGGLLYGTSSLQFPTPPGSVDILRYSAAQLSSAIGPTVLTLQDAAVRYQGLDSAGSLAIDNDDDLFVVDWSNHTLLELSDIGSAAPRRTTFLTYPTAGPSATRVQFVPAGGIVPGVFEPYQPASGGELVVFESTFSGPALLRRIRPERPDLAVQPASPVPAGPFQLTVARAIPGAAFVLALAIGSPQLEFAFPLVGFEQPAIWNGTLAHPVLTVAGVLDGQGGLSLSGTSPGSLVALPFTVQVVFLDSFQRIVGTSNPLALTLR